MANDRVQNNLINVQAIAQWASYNLDHFYK